MGNNIVFVVDYCYSQLRHCRWVSWMADVLMMATRLSGLDYNRRRRAIVTSCRCMVCLTQLQQQESAIPQRLADAALLGVRLKTSLSRDGCCARGWQ